MKLSVIWLSLVIAVALLAMLVLGYFTYDNRLRLEGIANSLAEQVPREEAFILERAEQAVELAFNLLGLFEALSLSIIYSFNDYRIPH